MQWAAPFFETGTEFNSCRSLDSAWRTLVSMAERARQGKRRRALLESNPPRNSLLETHSDESPGRAEPSLAPQSFWTSE
jgi:hypothetical protein